MQPLHMNAFEPDGSDEWASARTERRKQAFRTRDLPRERRDPGARLGLDGRVVRSRRHRHVARVTGAFRRPAGMQGRGLINGEQALTGLEALAGSSSGKIAVGWTLLATSAGSRVHLLQRGDHIRRIRRIGHTATTSQHPYTASLSQSTPIGQRPGSPQSALNDQEEALIPGD